MTKRFLGYTAEELQTLGASDTAKEISGQPSLWVETGSLIRNIKEKIRSFLENIYQRENVNIILTGAGSSAFIGEILEGPFQKNSRIPTRAIPTTNLVTHPEYYLKKNSPTLIISFARSGNSPESMATVNIANSYSWEIYHLVITCNPSGNITRLIRPEKDLLIVLPEGTNDNGLAMTGSFTSMTLAAYLISRIDEPDNYRPLVDRMADYGNRIIAEYRDMLFSISELKFTRAIFLGSGPMLGSSRESHLKLQELTSGKIICKHDSYLGFRHGPKAVIDRNSLLFFLMSNDPYVQKYESDLLTEIDNGEKGLCRVAIAEQMPHIKGFEELILTGTEEGDKLDETLLAIVNVLPAQMVGFFKSIILGLKPDSPSDNGAISRVVQGVNIYDFEP